MKSASKLTAIALAALMTSTSFMAHAASAPDPAMVYQTQKKMLRTADEALTVLTRAHAARLALFDNDIETAQAKLAEARVAFDKAEKTMNDLTIGDTEDPTNPTQYLPFDMSMTLTDGFVATDENKLALEKAYGLMQTASPDDAIEVLRLASIDVNVSAALLPIVEASEQVQKAQTFLDDGEYFKANLALKALEDSVITRTFSIDAIPQQGDIS
ncbi:MAG: YfdX family protein [Rhodobacteraceae bacterium]|nr:YfdX family protein [Paracoccaceae bacterium]